MGLGLSMGVSKHSEFWQNKTHNHEDVIICFDLRNITYDSRST